MLSMLLSVCGSLFCVFYFFAALLVIFVTFFFWDWFLGVTTSSPPLTSRGAVRVLWHEGGWGLCPKVRLSSLMLA